MKKQKKRIIDATQKAIEKRVVGYWMAGIVFITMLLAFARFFNNSNMLFIECVAEVWMMHWPVFACSLGLLPIAMIDFLRLSQRFVEPISRIRKELKCFHSGKEMHKIHCNAGDFWTDLSDGVNHLSDRIKQLESEKKNPV